MKLHRLENLIIALRHENAALKLQNEGLRADNDALLTRVEVVVKEMREDWYCDHPDDDRRQRDEWADKLEGKI